jgi:hypothetical protein
MESAAGFGATVFHSIGSPPLKRKASIGLARKGVLLEIARSIK